MSNPNIQLLTIKDCCESGRISRTTFYRLSKTDPNFPELLKIGSSTRVRSDGWAAYIDASGTRNGEAA